MRHYWVDRISVLEPGVRATGVKAVGQSEDFFDHHFPGNPIYPGIYLIEGLAQTAGFMLSAPTPERFAMMASVDRARFGRIVRPGDLVTFRVEREHEQDQLIRIQGTATVRDQTVARAAITFRMLDLQDVIPPEYVPMWRRMMTNLVREEATE